MLKDAQLYKLLRERGVKCKANDRAKAEEVLVLIRDHNILKPWLSFNKEGKNEADCFVAARGMLVRLERLPVAEQERQMTEYFTTMGKDVPEYITLTGTNVRSMARRMFAAQVTGSVVDENALSDPYADYRLPAKEPLSVNGVLQSELLKEQKLERISALFSLR